MDAEDETQDQPGQLNHDDEELSLKIGQQMRESKTNSADWRTMARQCYDFAAGRQWSDEDMAILEEQRRTPVVFNRVSRTLNAVIGLQVSNRQEVRFLPRGNEDTGFNEMMTNASRWVRDQCDAEDEETESFGDLLTSGMGWTETFLDYDEDPDGMIIVDRVDPMTMFWDAAATKKNIQDARWVARVKRMSIDEVQERWPDYEGGGAGEDWLDDEDEPHDASPPFYDSSEKNSGRAKDIEVVCYQWYEKETFVRVAQSNGQMIEFTPTRFAKLKERIDAFGLQYVEQSRRKYFQAFRIGSTIYDRDELAIQEGGFTLKCMTGMRDRNANSWFGLVSIMIDPQRWANKWLSQTMHIMNSNAKGGVLSEIGAFTNKKTAEADWAKPDAFIELEAGGLAKVQERQQANFPNGFNQLMQYAVEAISDTPGINQELMGLVGKEQPGVLESMRKQAGVTMLSVMFDSLRLYRKRQGRILAAFIRDYISDGRMVRLVGPQGARYVPLLRDQINMRYDTIIDEAPTSHNQKEKVMNILLHLVPTMMQAGMPPPPPEVLEYLPVPESLMEKWLAKTRPDPRQQQQAAQEEAQERAVLLQERAATAEALRASAQKDAASAQKTMKEVATPAEGLDPKILADIQSTREKAQIQAATDIEVARIRAVTQAEIEKMKLAGSAPNDDVLQHLQNLIGSQENQMESIKAALLSVTAAVAESQQSVYELQKPKKKSVTVLRDENGDISGAAVIENGPTAH